jgi:hypothetical protein
MPATVKNYSPLDVIAALLTFMDEKFNNDPRIIHTTIARLSKDAKYKDLLEDFEFLNYEPFPYSPLLGRTLNRLQEARLLSSINPSYKKYSISPESRRAITRQILNVKLADKKEQIKEISEELKTALKHK